MFIARWTCIRIEIPRGSKTNPTAIKRHVKNNVCCASLIHTPATLELVIIGKDTTTIPVPLQTYFMRNCSRTTYHSLCENIEFMCRAND